jgi:hypothetical protein
MKYTKGILSGCDRHQEWLLPWWYAHLRKHNPHYPIAFADFGMSSEGRNWCEERGILVDAPIVNPRQTSALRIGENFWEQWKPEDLSLKDQPLVWFAKPLVFAKSPFDRTLWIDLDCEIRADVTPIFSYPLSKTKLRAVRGLKFAIRNISKNKEYLIRGYNSGVVLFEKDSVVLEHWIRVTLAEGSYSFYGGDDRLLSLVIALLRVKKIVLPSIFNWNATGRGENPNALIHHWLGEGGKHVIRFFLYTQTI